MIGGAVVGAGVVGGVSVLRGGDQEARVAVATSISPPSARVSTPTTTATASRCAATTAPNLVVGDGPGSTDSGPQVILALEHAYYAARDGHAVRSLLAPDAQAGTNAQIQAGIEERPVGTTHCVEIRPDGHDRWAVTLTEHRPGGHLVVHHQSVTTKRLDGRAVVVSVVEKSTDEK